LVKGRLWVHAACTKPVRGLGKVKRNLSLSHGQVIYPRWRPVLVAGQALCPRWKLSQSNLSQLVPQSWTTRPWKSLLSACVHCELISSFEPPSAQGWTHRTLTVHERTSVHFLVLPGSLFQLLRLRSTDILVH